MFKRIISILFSVIIFVVTICSQTNVFAYDEAAKVTIQESGTAYAGDEVTIYITAEFNADVAIQGIQVDFNFTDNFNNINLTSSITSNNTGWFTGLTKNNLTGVGSTITSGGLIEGKFIFTIPTDAETGTEYTIDISNVKVSDTSSNPLDSIIENKSVTITVVGKEIEDVVVGDYNGTYDGKAHSLNVSIPSGASIAYGTTEGDYSLTSVSYTDAGTYPVYYQVTMDGYETVTGSASINISPKEVTSSLISNISDVVYTGSQIIPDVVVSDGTPSIITENDYDLSYGSNVNAADGGTVTITGKGNYTGTAVKTFNIKKATLTASAEDLTITYGDDINLTVNYTGFVGTDTADVIKKQASAESLGTTPSAGTHAIVLSGAQADNYDFTYTEGAVLTVNKKSVSITSLGINAKEYDGTTLGTIDTSSVVFDGALSGDDLSITADSVEFASADIGENIAVSVTGIALSGSSAANYDLLTTSFDTVGTITEKITTTTTTESTTETTTAAESTTETTTVRHTGGGGGGGSSSVSATTTTTTTEATTETTTEVIETTTEATTSIISNDVKVSIGSSTVVVGDNSYTMDAAPYIQTSSNSTLVPLRFVAIAILGDDIENADDSSIIGWNAATKTASITANGKVIQFTANSNIMNINGNPVAMDNGVKAEITDGRMYIPFRALGNALGVDVDWDGTTKTAIYTLK